MICSTFFRHLSGTLFGVLDNLEVTASNVTKCISGHSLSTKSLDEKFSAQDGHNTFRSWASEGNLEATVHPVAKNGNKVLTCGNERYLGSDVNLPMEVARSNMCKFVVTEPPRVLLVP